MTEPSLDQGGDQDSDRCESESQDQQCHVHTVPLGIRYACYVGSAGVAKARRDAIDRHHEGSPQRGIRIEALIPFLTQSPQQLHL